MRAGGWVTAATGLAAFAASGAGCLGNRVLDTFCDDSSCAFSRDEWTRLQGLTNLGPPPRDTSNKVDGDARAIDLGRAFFFDARFSGNATQVDALRRPAAVARAPQGQPTNLSCASCHDLGRAGADTASIPGNVSSGAGWTDVNALGIVNCAYQQLFTWNGRADSLWAQAFAVAESPTTMNGNRLRTYWVIFDNYRTPYNVLWAPLGWLLPRTPPFPLSLPPFPLDGKPGAKAGCQPDDPSEPFGDAWDCMAPGDQDAVTRVLVNWAKSLAAYEATLTSRNASFDRFMREGPESSAVGAAAKRGARLFVGKGGCIDCHNTPLLSDRDFHNVGVPQVGPAVPTEADCPAGGVCDCVTRPNGKNCLPWGALDGLVKLDASKRLTTSVLRTSMWSDEPRDQSRAAEMARAAEVAGAPNDALKGAWRTPSLRNVALTGPYMHDGVYQTLQQVVAHYDRGGDPGALGTRAVQIRPLGLTTGEQADLVAFLETLTESPEPATTGAGGAGGAGAAIGGMGVGGMGGPSGLAGRAGVTGVGGEGAGGTGGLSPACRTNPYSHASTFGALLDGWFVGANSTPPSLYPSTGVDGSPMTGTKVEIDPGDGSPAMNGSVKLTIPFDAPNEEMLFASGFTGVNLHGATVTAQIKLDSGLNTTPTDVGRAFLILKSTVAYNYVAGPAIALDSSAGWVGLTINADAPTATLPIGYDPCDIREIDVSIQTGATGTYTTAVVHIDTIAITRPGTAADAGASDGPPMRCPAGLPGGCTSEGATCALAPPGVTACPHDLRCVAGIWRPEPCGP